MTIIQEGPKALHLLRDAKEAVELAQGIESQHDRHFGGHLHGSRHPLLTLPLPRGYRRVKR